MTARIQEAGRTDEKQKPSSSQKKYGGVFPGCYGRGELLMWIVITPEQKYYDFIIHRN